MSSGSDQSGSSDSTSGDSGSYDIPDSGSNDSIGGHYESGAGSGGGRMTADVECNNDGCSVSVGGKWPIWSVKQ